LRKIRVRSRVNITSHNNRGSWGYVSLFSFFPTGLGFRCNPTFAISIIWLPIFPTHLLLFRYNELTLFGLGTEKERKATYTEYVLQDV
jgi:hypothetical protein